MIPYSLTSLNPEEDYVIAHSQGGLVAKTITRNNDHIGLFDGIVTLHSPHGGAQIVNNTDVNGPNMAVRIAQEGCTILSSALIREELNKPGILRALVSFFAGNRIVTAANQTCEGGLGLLLPFILSGQNTGSAKDFAVGSPFLSTLAGTGSQHRVSAWGIETNEEMMWRTLHWQVNDPNKEPIFGATDEKETNGLVKQKNDLINKFEARSVEIDEVISSSSCEQRIRIIRRLCNSNRQRIFKERFANQEAIRWLNTVNLKYLAMIGAYSEQGEKILCNCVKNGFDGRPVFTKIFEINSENECNSNNFPGFDEFILKYELIFNIEPSDGVVTVASGRAFDGATEGFLGFTNNHFQMRNSEGTSRFLLRLYRGQIDAFFKLEEL